MPSPPIPTDREYFQDLGLLEAPSPFGHELAPDQIPEDRRAFCSRSPEKLAESIDSNVTTSNFFNLPSFVNPDGQFKTGLCWWHSRMQRSTAYLAHFKPDAPRLDPALARAKIQSLLHDRDHVVEIPGFRNFYEFSQTYKEIFTEELDEASVNAFLNGESFSRIGDSSTWGNSQTAQSEIDGLYDQMRTDPAIRLFRIRASDHGLLDSHAWLVSGMEPLFAPPVPGNPLAATRRVGFKIKIVDSNVNQVETIEYRYGQTSLNYHGKDVRIYPYYTQDVPDLKKVVREYCVPPRKPGV